MFCNMPLHVDVPVLHLLLEVDDSPAVCRLGNLHGCLFCVRSSRL